MSGKRYCLGCGCYLPYTIKGSYCSDLCVRAFKNRRTPRQQEDFEKNAERRANPESFGDEKGGAQ